MEGYCHNQNRSPALLIDMEKLKRDNVIAVVIETMELKNIVTQFKKICICIHERLIFVY